MDVQVKGPVSAVQTAFHVNIHTYQHPNENRTFYAPDREPSVNLPFNPDESVAAWPSFNHVLAPELHTEHVANVYGMLTPGEGVEGRLPHGGPRGRPERAPARGAG